MAGERILIVEDERIVARDLEATLKKLGYEIAGIARGGTEALAKAAQTQPNLVLMDITLEGERDGVQTAAAIRERYGTPIVFLTAHTDRSTVERARATNPAGYVVKPFHARRLDEALRSVLSADDGAGGDSSQSLRVLLIEDASDTAAAIVGAIGKRHRVKVAPSLLQAVRMLRDAPVDLILLRLDVADAGRAQGLRRLREDLGVKAPAVLMAAEPTPQDMAQLKTEGVLACLTVDASLPEKLTQQIASLPASAAGG